MPNKKDRLRFLIHDAVNKLLLSSYHFNKLKNNLGSQNNRTFDLGLNFLNRSSELIHEIRNIVREDEDTKLVLHGEKMSVYKFFHEYVIPCFEDLGKKYGIKVDLSCYCGNKGKVESICIKVNYFKRAIENFLENSLEAGATEVMLSVKLDDSYLLMDYRDNGVGMPKSEVHKLNLKIQSKLLEGNGEGTLFVQKFGESLHGNVHYDSEEGEGMHIEVLIPLVGSLISCEPEEEQK